MCNETGEIWLIFNGEIWNFRQLREELTARGHVFRTTSDSETILHAYEDDGTDAIARLHGMFGLALWDAPRRRLLLARDRAGKKPLYYVRTPDGIVFGSEIKALLIHPAVPRQADTQALADFLSARYVPGPATLFEGIYKLRPGHWLTCEDGRLHEECYWDFRFGATASDSLAGYMAGVRHHITRAVEERMMADVPVGALLSGGVDSSIVTGTMASLTGEPVRTFAVGFDVPGYSELPYARLVAEHFGTEHHELMVTSAELPRSWPLLTWHRDEPVSEPSDLGMYLVARLARQHVKVVLSGEGGDELFAGYPKYAVDWLARYYQMLPASARERVVAPWLDRLPYSLRKVQLAGRMLAQPAPERWMMWFGIFNGHLKDELLSERVKASAAMDASRVFRDWLQQGAPRDDISAMLYLDTKVWLPDNLLMKSDKMTMAASLEARLPLLDYQLIEYAASIPTKVKLRLFRPKYLLKRAYADFLPEAVLTRKKMGFNVPTGVWFRGDQRGWLMRLLLSERLRSRGLFDPACVARLLRDHLEGRTNYQAQLFTLASLELWFRVFIDPPTLEPALTDPHAAAQAIYQELYEDEPARARTSL
jgi:asparagine synthase (glutamine-hydrolysing)